MKKIIAAALAAAAMLVMTAVAADIDGTWVAVTQGPKGEQKQTLTLKADGAKLSGTMEGGFGGATPIAEGMMTGNEVSFKVVREFNGNKVENMWKGTMAAGELKLTRAAAPGGKGGPQELTFKKQ
jgi:hypothetical protein